MLAIVIARRQIQTFNYSGSHFGAYTSHLTPYLLTQTLPPPCQGEGLGVRLKNVHHANKNTQRLPDAVKELSFIFFSPILLRPNLNGYFNR